MSNKNTRRKRIWDLLSHIPSFALRFLRLMSFVAFLLPAFVVFVWHYLTCDRIAVYYGNSNNNNCHDNNMDNDDSKKDHNESERNTDSSVIRIMNAIYDGVSSSSSSRTEKLRKKCKDPFFSRHYVDIYGSRTPLPSSAADQPHEIEDETEKKRPVVIFITGGAWIIGYRMWGTLLARALAPFGILVFVPDYRNFPRVDIEGMVRDVDTSIQWAFDHAEEYGGDREKVVLVGQSAGAHIGGVLVATKVWDWLRKERRRRCANMELSNNGTKHNSMHGEGDEVDMQDQSDVEFPLALNSTYSPQQLRGFISTSAPHNLVSMRPVFHHHGLSANVQRSIFGGLHNGDDSQEEEEDDVFEKWSPYHLVMKCHEEYARLMEQLGAAGRRKHNMESLELKDIFPKLCVIHGTEDKTVPVKEAVEFISLLTKLNIPTETRMYKGWSHTDPILEAPMRGNHTYHRDIFEHVRLWTSSSSTSNSCRNGQKNDGNVFDSLVRNWNGYDSCGHLDGEQTNGQQIHNTATLFDERHLILRPICPSILVEAARFCNPF